MRQQIDVNRNVDKTVLEWCQDEVTRITCVEIADDNTVVPKVVVAWDPTPDLEIEGKKRQRRVRWNLKGITGKETQRMVGEWMLIWIY